MIVDSSAASTTPPAATQQRRTGHSLLPKIIEGHNIGLWLGFHPANVG
jgi:hypothetical protein